jgi:hypothetical protein
VHTSSLLQETSLVISNPISRMGSPYHNATPLR